MSKNKKNIKSIIAVAVLLVLVIGAFTAWKLLSPKPRDSQTETKPRVTAAAEKEAAAPAETAAPAAKPEEEAAPPAEPEAETAEAAAEAAEPETEAAEPEPEAAEPEAEPAEPAEAEEDLVTITVTITHKDGSARDLTITTGALTLLDAMLEQDLLEYTVDVYTTVTAVDGEAADMENNEWWMIYTDKEWTKWTDAVDKVYIEDGDHYEFVYMVF